MKILSLLIRIGGIEIATRSMLFLTTIILARGLKPTEFSEFVFFWSAVQFLWLVVEMGTTTYGTREVAFNRASVPDRYREIVSIRVANGVTILVFFLVFFEFFFRWKFHAAGRAFYSVSFHKITFLSVLIKIQVVPRHS